MTSRAGTCRATKPARNGFTLIEVIVVIIIMAVAASIAVPAYSNFWDRTQFNAAAASVRDIFAYAREQAIVNDTTTSITYSQGGAAFMVTTQVPPPQMDLPTALASENSPMTSSSTPQMRALPLGENIAIRDFTTGGSMGDNTLHFRSDGTSEGATLTILGANGDAAHLMVSPSTGRVTMEDPSGGPL